MKKYIIITLGTSFSLLMNSCGKETKKDEVEEVTTTVSSTILNLSDEQLKSFPIDTVTFQNKNLSTTIRLNAKTAITPQNTVSITNPFGGYVKRISLIPGNNVRKGDVVAVLEDPQYIQMQEDYLTTIALLEQANEDYIRQRDLNAEQAASDKVMQQAKATKQTLMVKKQSLEEKLRLININPAGVRLNNIKRTINIYAPISGRINEVFVNTGQYVSPANAMIEIVNPNNSLLNIKVFEKDLGSIQIGQNLDAYTNANPNQKLNAQVTAISNQVNADGTIDVYAKITNLNSIQITENMYFNVELNVSQLRANVLPEEAIVQYDGKNYIFEQVNKNKYVLTPVETGISSMKMVEIKSPANRSKIYVGKGSYNLLTSLKNKE